MKTRNLLFALTLPAAFAACSQDEFATEESGVSLAGRKSIGEITLVTDAQTRINIGDNGFEFKDEDALSAALIDAPYTGLTGQHDYAYDNYWITPYISSNYKFEKKGGSWSSKAAMVEGNYIFLAPYVNHSVRKPMEATLPAEQNLKLDASGKIDEKSAIQGVLDGKNPVFIGHRFLAADAGTEQGINFYSIYSYPKITVKNTDALRKPVIVKKVLLKKDGGFTLNAPFSNASVREALLNEVFAPQGEDTKDQALMGAWAKIASKNFGVKANYDGANKKEGEALPTTLELTTLNIGGTVNKPSSSNQKTAWKNGLVGKTSDLLTTPETKGQYIVINFPGDGYKLDYGESVSFNAVVPADEYKVKSNGETDLLHLYVVVNTSVEGTGTVTKVWEKELDSRSEYLTLYPGKSYPNQDYNGTELRSNKGGYFTILTGTEADGDVTASQSVDATKFESVGVVTTTEELLAAIANIQSNLKQVIEVNGKNVKFNEAVNEAVANTNCQEITIQGLVYVDASDCDGKTMKVNDRIAFEEVVIESGKVIFNGSANKLGQVFVAPKATLELEKLADNGAKITNVGKLKLAANVANVFNYGGLEIAANMGNTYIRNMYKACEDDYWMKGYKHEAIISLSINLTPSVHVLAGGIYKVVDDIDYPITVDKKTNTKSAGVLKIDGQVAIKKCSYERGRMGYGSITNNGVIEGNGTLVVNRGLGMTNNAGAEIRVFVEIEGASHSLAELAETPVESWEYDGSIATVTNSGTMSNVKIDGLLIMASSEARVNGSITMTEGADGEIDNTAKAVVENTLEKLVVFAKLPEMNFLTDEGTLQTLADMKAYGKSTAVKVFRLAGPMKIGNGYGTSGMNNLSAADLGGDGNRVIEFVSGSSVKMGECTFNATNCIKVSAKDVKVSGRTEGTSTFNVTGLEKGLYVTTVSDTDDRWTAVEGRFKSDGTCKVEGTSENAEDENTGNEGSGETGDVVNAEM